MEYTPSYTTKRLYRYVLNGLYVWTDDYVVASTNATGRVIKGCKSFQSEAVMPCKNKYTW